MKIHKQHIHIIGIGGISLSALARLLQAKGYTVTGVDDTPSNILHSLKKYGIATKLHACKAWVKRADLVVYSSAIPDTHPDLVLAKALHKTICSRAKLLGAIASMYPKTVAVSGAHGKTTCTAMIAQMLLTASRTPTVHVGGIMPFMHGNVHVGKGDIFLTEACEYKDSFLELAPFIGIILNIQPDHLDYFKTFANMQNSFAIFAHKIDVCGFCIINADDMYANKTTSFAHTLTFGVHQKADITASNICLNSLGNAGFDVFVFGSFIGHVQLAVPGEHQVYNALAALCACVCLGLSFKECLPGLEGFSGVERRFEHIGTLHGAQVIADYAHHPEEIKATLALCKRITKGKLYVVFQPHTFSRTKDLWSDFVQCFTSADEVCIAPIYPAREQPIEGITHISLANAIYMQGTKAYAKTAEQMLAFYPNMVKPQDCLLVLGAGDIIEFAHKIVEQNV